MARTIQLEEAFSLYHELLEEAHEKKMWFKARGLNLWLSPFELLDGWDDGKYLYPIKYWELRKPHEYLRSFSNTLRKAQNRYDYAHKRVATYTQKLNNNLC